MIVGFDGDVIMHTSASLEYSNPDITLEECRIVCHQLINNILEKYSTKSYKLVLTSKDESNFRFQVAKTRPYKGNRKPSPHKWLGKVREYLLENCGGFEVHGMEADDWLGMWQCDNLGKGIESVICSTDKDLKQIPGLHCDLKGNEILVEDMGNLLFYRDNQNKPVVKGTGIIWCYCQMITGDTIDNIPGAKGKGALFAYNALHKCKTELELYKATLKAFDNNEELMDEMAQLVYILRKENQYWSHRKEELLNVKER